MRFLSQQISNNEWYTPYESVIEFIDKLKISKDKIIWLPFDKDNSNFVICLKERGYKVVNTHIDNGKNFFDSEPQKFDIIISNPPFTRKRLVIERCLQFNKPFALLYGCSIFCQSLGNTLNKCKFYFIQKQIKFYNDKNETNKFLCCWVMSKDFPFKES